jgi:hypothetical protein
MTLPLLEICRSEQKTSSSFPGIISGKQFLMKRSSAQILSYNYTTRFHSRYHEQLPRNAAPLAEGTTIETLLSTRIHSSFRRNRSIAAFAAYALATSHACFHRASATRSSYRAWA